MITSTNNDRIKAARRLHDSRHKRRTGELLLEGVRLIDDALQSGVTPKCVFYAPDAVAQTGETQRLLQALLERSVECVCVSSPVLLSLAQTVTPQGMVAVVNAPDLPVPADPSLSLVLDGVSDPGNAGTLLRSAEAAGAQLVVFGPDSVNPYIGKVLRAGMGAHFRIPMRVCSDWAEVRATVGDTARLYVAEASAALGYDEVDWTTPAVLIVGSEAHGPGDQARAAATPITIPMHGRVESLNAAMAGSIILFEAARQRARYVQKQR